MIDEEILKHIDQRMDEVATRAAKQAAQEAFDGVADFLKRFENVIMERFDRLEAGQGELREDLREFRSGLSRVDGRLYRLEEHVTKGHEPRLSALEAQAQ